MVKVLECQAKDDKLHPQATGSHSLEVREQRYSPGRRKGGGPGEWKQMMRERK